MVVLTQDLQGIDMDGQQRVSFVADLGSSLLTLSPDLLSPLLETLGVGGGPGSP